MDPPPDTPHGGDRLFGYIEGRPIYLDDLRYALVIITITVILLSFLTEASEYFPVKGS